MFVAVTFCGDEDGPVGEEKTAANQQQQQQQQLVVYASSATPTPYLLWQKHFLPSHMAIRT